MRKKRVLTSPEQTHATVSPQELKQWRKERKWTQKEAADQLGVTLRAYENWEQGVAPMQYPIAMRKLMDQANKRRGTS